MSDILLSWQETLQLFTPAELPLLTLAIARASGRALYKLMTTFWWLSTLLAIFFFFRWFECIGYPQAGQSAALALLQTAALFLLRASVGQVTVRSLVGSVRGILLMVITICLIAWCPYQIVLMPVIPLMLLWLMDAPTTFRGMQRALRNSCRMLLYNAPYFLLIFVSMYLLLIGGHALGSLLPLQEPWDLVLAIPLLVVLLVAYESLIWYGYTRCLRGSMHRYY